MSAGGDQKKNKTLADKNDNKVNVYGDLSDTLETADHEKLDRLVTQIYPDLKKLARFQLSGERAGHTLSTTAIVNEAFVRMRASGPEWQDRAHFFRVAARVMRHLLVDHARKRLSAKRGGGQDDLDIDDHLASTADDTVAVLAINDALKKIEDIDSRMAQVVEYRYFAGLSTEETAETLGIGVRTVERDWQRARAYIHRALDAEN